jgi:hypothetical protein
MKPLNIITVAYNKPEFIEYQYKSFKKFILSEFDYIVYNNADNPVFKKEIYETCIKQNISIIDVPDNHGGPSERAGFSLNFAINDIRKNFNNNLMIVDSDIFLVDYYDIISNYDFLGRYWNIEHIFYYTNHFLQLNLTKVPIDKDFDFLPIIIDNIRLDCGGALYNYFRNNPEVNHGGIKVIPRNYITKENMDRYELLNKNIHLKDFFKRECDIFGNKCNFSELFQDVFIHLRAGSNWINIDNIKQKEREKNLYYLIRNLTE